MKKFKYNPNSVYVFEGPDTTNLTLGSKEIVIINGESKKYTVIFSNGKIFEPKTDSFFAKEFKQFGKVCGYEIIQEWK